MKRFLTVLLILSMAGVISRAQWIPQSSPTDRSLYDVQFADTQNGWIVGAEVILRTTDGGQTWVKQDHPGRFYADIHMLDQNVGWAVGYAGTAEWNSDRAIAAMTTDGGSTWSTVDFLSDTYFSAVSFADPSNGWIVGGFVYPDSSGIVHRTTNGGTSWQRIDDGSLLALNDVWFTSPLNGCVVGEYGQVYTTTDAGTSWQLAATATNGMFDAPLRAMHFTSNDSGWVVGGLSGHQVIGRTTDGGSSWQFAFDVNGTTVRDAQMISSQTGWIVGGISGAYKIAKTTDGGTSWIIQDHGLGDQNTDYLEAVYMLNDHVGWIVGRNGNILKTETGGVTGVSRSFDGVPDEYSLEQNYPNPFNPATEIRYTVAAPSGVEGHVRLSVFDVLGREVARVVDEAKPAGVHTATWNASAFSSGIYFYKLEVRGGGGVRFVETRKMVLIR